MDKTSHERTGGSSFSRRDTGYASHIPNTSLLVSSTVLDIAHAKLSVCVWMLDGLAWTHYWQRQSIVTYSLHPMPNGRQPPIPLFTPTCPAYISIFMGLRLHLGIRLGLKPEARGTATLRRMDQPKVWIIGERNIPQTHSKKRLREERLDLRDGLKGMDRL